MFPCLNNSHGNYHDKIDLRSWGSPVIVFFLSRDFDATRIASQDIHRVRRAYNNRTPKMKALKARDGKRRVQFLKGCSTK
ncbi:unnamed protein product [Linum trigynum]|uniref:Uncharacterized protein n=1 Tax=Linum trigynum TaxID=586398 RepID=A0AAV2FLB4_9ROSI